MQNKSELEIKIKEIVSILEKQNNIDDLVEALNFAREKLSYISPFKSEPVDFVKWVKNENVVANDYNPNKVAPPEMQLLEVSINNDGYTQPIVTFPSDNKIEVVDGFHRSRVGKESKIIKKRVYGYLPVVSIKKDKQSKNERIASTIRHNRARGKHQIDAMSEIVLELKNRNWKNSRIAKELGMDEDEILRLCQITGLEGLFSDKDFSKSWEAEEVGNAFVELTDNISDELIDGVRTANTNDPTRIFHTFDKWECNKAGFYNSKVEGKSGEECEAIFAKLLSDKKEFKKALNGVLKNWKYSCEHYLTNKAMNRIAWLGQASVCYATGIPNKYSSGWFLLTKEQQDEANKIALSGLNKWLIEHGMEKLTMEEAISLGRQVEIY